MRLQDMTFDLDKARVDAAYVGNICLTYEEWPETDNDMQYILAAVYDLEPALDEIERQAARIKELEKLLAHIDTQAAQIEALKEKLVEERAQVLAGKGNLIWEPLPDDDRPDGLYPALVIRGKAYWRTVAHQQIEAEMVGVELE